MLVLKKYLTFLGNEARNSILFSAEGLENKIIEIETDDFEKQWEFLKIMSTSENRVKNLQNWTKKFNASNHEIEDIIEFLVQNHLVFEYNEKIESNKKRLLNFYGSIGVTFNRYKCLDIVEKYCAIVIGLGTVGSEVIKCLLQLGVKNFILIDGDRVTKENIIQQTFFEEKDIGKYKTEALATKIRDLDQTIFVECFAEYIDSNKLLNAILSKNEKSSIFCTFDGITPKLLHEIFFTSKTFNTQAYISGYSKFSLFATILSEKFITEYEKNFSDFSDIISENSGIGLYGSLSGVLLSRIWLQNVFEKVNTGEEYLEFSYWNGFLNKFDSDVYQYKLPKKINDNNYLNYVRKFIIESHIKKLYFNYLNKDDMDILSYIEYVSEKFDIEIEDIFEVEDEYVALLEKLTINYEEDTYTVSDFYDSFYSPSMEEEYIKEFNNTLKLLIPYAIQTLKQKNSVHYLDFVQEKAKQEKFVWRLQQCSHKLIKMIFQNHIVDFNEDIFRDTNSMSFSQSVQSTIISEIDQLVPGYDVGNFLAFLLEHQLINISKKNKISAYYFDQRFKVPYIVISSGEFLEDLLSYGHEIGHAYFESFIQNRYTIEQLNDETKEFFAMINEILTLFSLLKNKGELISIREILTYLFRVITQTFALDILEGEVMEMISRKSTFNYKDIIEAREKVNQRIFDGY